MGDEFVAMPVDVAKRPERALAAFILGTCIDERALAPREGRFVMFALDQILPYLRAKGLEQPAEIAGDRVVAPNRVRPLDEVIDTEKGQRPAKESHDPEPIRPRRIERGGDRDRHAKKQRHIPAERKPFFIAAWRHIHALTPPGVRTKRLPSRRPRL
jgi:hypothetical protein